MSGFAVLKNTKIENNKANLESNKTLEDITLGNKLKNSREAKKLSICEIAEQLHLKSTVLTSFENDIFTLPDIPVAYTKGYLRSYLRFLDLPEDLMNSVTCGGKKTAMFKPTPVKYNTKSHCNLIKYLTILVLLIAFSMTGVWWWQNHQQEQTKRDLLVSSNSSIISENNNQAIEVDASPFISSKESEAKQDKAQSTVNVESTKEENILPITNKINSEEVKQKATPPANSLKIENLQENKMQSETNNLTTQQERQNDNLSSTNKANAEVKNEIEKPTNVLLQVQPSDSTSEKESSQEQTSSSDAVIPTDELYIKIVSAPSWITVKGKHNKTLTAKIYKAGEVLSFNDNERYKLTIGAPINVKVYYKGEVIPLKLDGRVARIRLPLN